MRAYKESLSTIRYVRTVRIVYFVIPANAGISGCGIGGEIPGRGRDDVPVGSRGGVQGAVVDDPVHENGTDCAFRHPGERRDLGCGIGGEIPGRGPG